VWNAFSGYRDVYGTLPPARKVRRVRLYLAARNERQAELEAQKMQEIEDIKRGKKPQR